MALVTSLKSIQYSINETLTEEKKLWIVRNFSDNYVAIYWEQIVRDIYKLIKDTHDFVVYLIDDTDLFIGNLCVCFF